MEAARSLAPSLSAGAVTIHGTPPSPPRTWWRRRRKLPAAPPCRRAALRRGLLEGSSAPSTIASTPGAAPPRRSRGRRGVLARWRWRPVPPRTPPPPPSPVRAPRARVDLLLGHAGIERQRHRDHEDPDRLDRGGVDRGVVGGLARHQPGRRLHDVIVERAPQQRHQDRSVVSSTAGSERSTAGATVTRRSSEVSSARR